MTRKHLLILLTVTALFQFPGGGVLGQDRRAGAEWIELGDRAYDGADYKTAAAHYTAGLSESPALLEGYFRRALARTQLRDYAGALTDFSIFLEKHPDHFEALLGRANAYRELKRYREARADYLRLLSAPRAETGSVLYQSSNLHRGTTSITTAQSGIDGIIYNYLGVVSTRLGDTKEATAWFDKALAASPGAADYYANRGVAHEATNRELAIRDYEKALELDPAHAQALLNLGALKGPAGNGYLAKAIESDSTFVFAYLERGYQRMTEGKFGEALADYNAALKLDPDNASTILNRGVVKEKMGDLAGAYADYSRAIALDDNFGKAWVNRGNVLAKQGRHKEAEADYSAALAADPDYAAALYNRAIARQRLGQLSGACEDLRRAEALGHKGDPALGARVCD